MRYCNAAVFAPGCLAKERNVFVSKLGATTAPLPLALEAPPQGFVEADVDSSSATGVPRIVALVRPGTTLTPVPTEATTFDPRPKPEGLEDDLPS
jgi:hypothetical protein